MKKPSMSLSNISERIVFEITGIPNNKDIETNQIVKEISQILNVEIKDTDISTSHPLPDNKKARNRLIVKFTRRDNKEKMYKARKKMIGKTANSLPSFNATSRRSDRTDPKIYINESMRKTRKKIFAQAYKFKKTNDFKYIWTTNGKILVRESEKSPVYTITTMRDLNEVTNYAE